MCGIAGAITRSTAVNLPSKVRRMNACLSHRGPDSHGWTTHEGVTLAIRRLSIIDVVAGDQPLYNETHDIAIVGNGEIYNYLELQQALRKRGHILRTGSDIETVAHLYEEKGWKCVDQLRGMFALALHDRKRKKVFLFRDRLGEKPLYYTQIKSEWFFASEMKALLTLPVDKTLNYASFDDYFHFYHIPEPQTAFTHIHKLEAGKVLEIDVQTLKAKLHTYWHPEQFEEIKNHNPQPLITQILEDSCKLTLRSDVPVGIALSGGIDSSAIAAICQKSGAKNITALSIGYPNAARVDERKYARSLAKKLGLTYVEAEIEDTSVVESFPKMVWDCDDPIAEIGMFNIHALYKLAHEQGIKVILNGIGGDELFWGYPWVNQAASLSLNKLTQAKELKSSAIASFIPQWAQRPKLYQKIFGLTLNTFFSPAEQLIFSDTQMGFRGGEQVIKHWYHPEMKRRVQHKDNLAMLTYKGKVSPTHVGRRINQMLLNSWLVSHAVCINDRLSMANSVETRSPFLDHKFFELALTNKQMLTSFDKPPKFWLKEALRGTLDQEILTRPKKGFSPPTARWLSKIIWKYLPLLDDGFLVQSEIINEKRLPLIKASYAYPYAWYYLFQLLALELWGRQFVMGEQPSPKYYLFAILLLGLSAILADPEMSLLPSRIPFHSYPHT